MAETADATPSTSRGSKTLGAKAAPVPDNPAGSPAPGATPAPAGAASVPASTPEAPDRAPTQPPAAGTGVTPPPSARPANSSEAAAATAKPAEATSTTAAAAEAAAAPAATTAKTAEDAQKGSKAVAAIDGADKSISKSAGGAGAGMAARETANAAIAKGETTGPRAHAARYTGAAAGGAAEGAMAGGAHGAAVGAAKGVAVEGSKDVIKDVSKGGRSKVLRGAAIGGAAATAPIAGVTLIMIMIFKWLKSLFFAMAAQLLNLLNAFWQLVLYVVKAVAGAIAGFISSVGGAIAGVGAAVLGFGAVAIAPAAAVATGVVATVAMLSLVGSLLGGLFGWGNRDEGLIAASGSGTCVRTASHTESGTPDAPLPQAEDNAKTIYSVLKSWGMPDENIAGILGNWSQESGGMDPTAVERIYDEPYRIGPRKQAAWDGGFTHVEGQSHGGIGLGQWSNGRTVMLLDFADDAGRPWHTIETQLAFMRSADSGKGVVEHMISTSLGGPREAADYFHDRWEISADNAAQQAERGDSAEMWFGRMSGWTVDGGVADIIDDILDLIGDGTEWVMSGGRDDCDSGSTSLAGLVDGGLTKEQADALVAQYNAEGHSWLMDRYHGGGPGRCNGNYVENCVSFSVYFVNRYTTFDQYPFGHGRDTAGSIARMSDRETTDTPTAYSVFSHRNSSSYGHTGVVLAVEGDSILIGEAGYCAFEGRTRWVPATEWKDGNWEFVDVSDLVDPAADLDDGARATAL